jgi:ribonucleoside-diphosphate reductase alpha chain
MSSNSKAVTKIQKRDGRLMDFDASKITQAIVKAFNATEEIGDESRQREEAKRLTPIAVDLFSRTVNGETPSVETMQDVVEQVLMAAGYYKTAKAYILYRAEHAGEREAKSEIGVEDDLGLSLNQLKVMESRYLRHDDEGTVAETPRQLFERVAKAIAANEEKDKKKWQKLFLEMMTSFEFVPGGGYLRTAGLKKSMLANCFVLPVEDSMEGIFNSVKWMALIQQKGGGTGFNFSNLRPKGDYVVSSGGYSSGPISFMKVFDAATRQIMQGGFRRGANMGILNVDHPDIFDFITCKTEEQEVNNFNISVGINDEFMEAVEKDRDFKLLNPRTKEVVQTVPACNLFNQIVTLAWRTGDPGIIFLDAINRNNPVIDTLGPLQATNPCGEQPLHPFDVCNLGSLNLAKFVVPSNGKIGQQVNWKRLEEVVRLAVRFLDNGVDVSLYPLPEVEKQARANRRIGLGIMGWADMLYQLETPYNSQIAVDLAQKVMRFIYSVSHNESEILAEEKGVFKNWKGSLYEKKGVKQRNLAITTIAPTGTISMVAECSSGIEPVFLLSYVKNVVSDEGLTYVNPYFEKALKEAVGNKEEYLEIIEKVTKNGSCQNIPELPEKIRKIFVTAHDITWEDHVLMQAAFQKYTDNAVSKTINFPHDATIEDIEKAYLLAWKLGCKGITIYRDGSKSVQILKKNQSKSAEAKASISKKAEPIIQSKIKIKSLKERIREEKATINGLQVSSLSNEDSKTLNTKPPKTRNPKLDSLCPECSSPLQMSEGCSMCLSCGFSKCSL